MSGIVFLGVTESGKSTLIQKLFGTNKENSSSPRKTKNEAILTYKSILIYDTPGLEKNLSTSKHNTATSYIIIIDSRKQLEPQKNAIVAKLQTILALKGTLIFVATKCLERRKKLAFTQKELKEFANAIATEFKVGVTIQLSDCIAPKLDVIEEKESKEEKSISICPPEMLREIILANHLQRVKLKILNELKIHWTASFYKPHTGRLDAVRGAIFNSPNYLLIKQILSNQITLFKNSAGENIAVTEVPAEILEERWSTPPALKNKVGDEGLQNCPYYTAVNNAYKLIQTNLNIKSSPTPKSSKTNSDIELMETGTSKTNEHYHRLTRSSP